MLGAGEGWAKSILFNDRVRDEFATFFHRPQTLALGVCNGCQMMSNLRELIPGSELWPRFVRNTSDRFEARFSLVEVTQSPSLLLQGMVGSQMPIAVSHGEGRVEVRDAAHLAALESKGLVERIQSKDNKKHIEIALLDQAEIIIEAGLNAQKQFAQNVLRGLTEEETRLCIRVFDKICNNAEEQLKNDKENES